MKNFIKLIPDETFNELRRLAKYFCLGDEIEAEIKDYEKEYERKILLLINLIKNNRKVDTDESFLV